MIKTETDFVPVLSSHSVTNQETLSQLRKRLEDSLEDVMKLQRKLTSEKQTGPVSNKPVPKWTFTRWISIFGLAMIFLPGLIPCYLRLTEASLYDHPLMFGIGSDLGLIVWKGLTGLSITGLLLCFVFTIIFMIGAALGIRNGWRNKGRNPAP